MRQFFKDLKFNIKALLDDKTTAREARLQFVGVRNKAIAAINQFAQSMNAAVPDKGEQLAMRWYAEAKGDAATLQAWADHPKMEPYRAEIQQAMNLSDAAKAQVERGQAYFKEAGEVAKEADVIKNVREEYNLNHVYLPDEEQDFVKTEMRGGIKPSSGHAKLRVFDTLAQAVIEGDKKIAPIGYSDLVGVHGTEMANAISSRTFLDSLHEAGLGGWKNEAPAGWSQVGKLEKSRPFVDAKTGEAGVATYKFYAPDGIANGLRAVTDPNYLRMWDVARGLDRYQSLVKTVDLSFSLFHHISLLAATLNEGNYQTLLNLPFVDEKMADLDWQAIEQDGAKHTLMSDAVHPNMDYARDLTQGGEGLDAKVRNAPVIKQGLELADKNAKFLFGKWARYMKVNAYGSAVADWVAKNPLADDEQLTAAKRDIARHVNATFGGQNWEAMGLSKSSVLGMRLGLLAPDWFTSNAQFMMQAFEKGPAGSLTRGHLARAAVYGTLAGEALSYVFAGHSMDKNPKGHETEAQVAPHVYFSPFRGGPGEALKVYSMLRESGVQAPGRYAQAKGSPITRGVAGFLTGVKYNGQPIVPRTEKTQPYVSEETGRERTTAPTTKTQAVYEFAKWLVGAAAPVPFGVSGLYEYAKSGEATPIGTLFVASGLGRYSPPPKEKKKAGEAAALGLP